MNTQQRAAEAAYRERKATQLTAAAIDRWGAEHAHRHVTAEGFDWDTFASDNGRPAPSEETIRIVTSRCAMAAASATAAPKSEAEVMAGIGFPQ